MFIIILRLDFSSNCLSLTRVEVDKLKKGSEKSDGWLNARYFQAKILLVWSQLTPSYLSIKPSELKKNMVINRQNRSNSPIIPGFYIPNKPVFHIGGDQAINQIFNANSLATPCFCMLTGLMIQATRQATEPLTLDLPLHKHQPFYCAMEHHTPSLLDDWLIGSIKLF